MKTIAKIFAALSALLAGLFFLERRRAQHLEVENDENKNNAEAAPVAAAVAELEKKVTQDEKTTEDSLAAYDKYRATHPIDDGGGNR